MVAQLGGCGKKRRKEENKEVNTARGRKKKPCGKREERRSWGEEDGWCEKTMKTMRKNEEA